MTEWEVDFVGYAPEYGTAVKILADTEDEAKLEAGHYVADFYPELVDVEFKEVRKLT